MSQLKLLNWLKKKRRLYTDPNLWDSEIMQHVCTPLKATHIYSPQGYIFPSTWSDCYLCFSPWANLIFHSRVIEVRTCLAIWKAIEVKCLSLVSAIEVPIDNTIEGTEALGHLRSRAVAGVWVGSLGISDGARCLPGFRPWNKALHHSSHRRFLWGGSSSGFCGKYLLSSKSPSF